MEFFKKHILFFIILIVLGALMGASLAMIYLDRQAASERHEELNRLVQERDRAKMRTPSPIPENLELAEANVNNLRETRAMVERVLTGTQTIQSDPSVDNVRFISSLQSYLSTFRRIVADENIVVPENFAFGFSRYAREAATPAQTAVPKLDMQRQILSFLINRLIEAEPFEIVAIQREQVEDSGQVARAGGGRQAAATGGDIFTIDPGLSARVSGAIDTLAFRVTFVGFTSSLRSFLNELALYEQPVVVRNVEVARFEPTQRRRTGGGGGGGATDDFARLFGIAEGAGGQETTTQVPVVDENMSRFTVTVEFITLAGENTPSN